jgi:hypothetical protein
MHHTLTFKLSRFFATAVAAVVAGCASPPTSVDTASNGVTPATDGGTTPDVGDGRGDGGKGGAGDPEFPTDPPGAGNFVFPQSIHSGFDGANVYKVPVATMLGERGDDGEGKASADIVWTSSDTTVATIEKVAKPKEETLPIPNWAMITTKKAGTATITATLGTEKATAQLTVVSYTAEQNAIGKTRYSTEGSGIAGGKCLTCHGPTGTDHSPTRIGAYDDSGLLSAITTAAYPDGRKLALTNHKWTIAETEKVGIVSYLRSLSPRGF